MKVLKIILILRKNPFTGGRTPNFFYGLERKEKTADPFKGDLLVKQNSISFIATHECANLHKLGVWLDRKLLI